MRSKRLCGSGAPVSTCRHIGSSTSHCQQKILHELARQLDRVPFDAGKAGHAEVVDPREQHVQAVAEFVEQRDDVAMRE
jgi:hypothetical protein